jgi:primosomal protein N' (replication factor Y)
MTNIKIISKDYEKAKEESNKVGSFLKENLKNSIILGPTVCSVFKMNNMYRFNIIIKYKKENNLYKTLTYLQEHYKNINNVDIDIDLNPLNI